MRRNPTNIVVGFDFVMTASTQFDYFLRGNTMFEDTTELRISSPGGLVAES
jgi:hypothetical protein